MPAGAPFPSAMPRSSSLRSAGPVVGLVLLDPGLLVDLLPTSRSGAGLAATLGEHALALLRRRARDLLAGLLGVLADLAACSFAVPVVLLVPGAEVPLPAPSKYGPPGSPVSCVMGGKPCPTLLTSRLLRLGVTCSEADQ